MNNRESHYLALFGAGLKDKRERAKLTVEDLAYRADIPLAEYRLIEAGKANISILEGRRIAVVLGTDLWAQLPQMMTREEVNAQVNQEKLNEKDS